MRNGIIILLFVMVTLLASKISHAEEALKLYVHPYLSPSKIIERFTPLADYLSMELDRHVSVHVAIDYDAHIENVGEGRVDIAYMGPASYVKLVDNFGFHPLLGRLEINGKPTLRGVIITLKESSLKELTDLKGRRFAFGDPNSTTSHLVPRFMLLESGLDVDDLEGYEFLSSHDNVALGVLMGDYDAGAVEEEIYLKYEKRGLKALTRTPEVFEHVFVASNLLPKDTVEALREALLKLEAHAGGTYILSALKEGATSLVPASDGDYDNLREIISALKEAGVEP